MLAKLRSRLTYANVMATIAVFIALGGGAYAAIKLPANSVGSKQLKKKAVTPKKVAPATVKLFKGQTGAQGSQGPKGEPGATGSTGQAGSSAASAFTGVTVTQPGLTRYAVPSGNSGNVNFQSGDQSGHGSGLSPNATIVARDLSVKIDTAPGGVESVAYTLIDDGLATAVGCTITGAATSCDSGGATASISPGSLISIRSQGSAGASTVQAHFGWRATTP